MTVVSKNWRNRPPSIKGGPWNPGDYDPSVSLVHRVEVQGITPLGIYECHPCLGWLTRTRPYFHLLCRVAQTLERFRGTWVHLRVLTSITYDITGCLYHPVQQAISVLRRKYGWKITGKKLRFQGGTCWYRLEKE